MRTSAERYCNEEPNIIFFKKLIGVTTCNIVRTLYWWFTLLQIVGGKIYEYCWNGNRYGRYQKPLSVL